MNEDWTVDQVGLAVPPHNWKDEVAESLYVDAGGPALVGAHRRLATAVTQQSLKLETYSNTPFTEDHARVMTTTVETLRAISAELDRWHYRMYPYLPERP